MSVKKISLVLPIVVFSLVLISSGAVSQEYDLKNKVKYQFDMVKTETSFDEACTYYNITYTGNSSNKPITPAINSLGVSGWKKVRGTVSDTWWEFRQNKTYQEEEIVGYENETYEETYYNNTTGDNVTVIKTREVPQYANITNWSYQWSVFDPPNFNPSRDIRLSSGETQHVKFCGDVEVEKLDDGYGYSVDHYPEFMDTTYDQYAWWNSSYSYRRDTLNTTDNGLIYPFTDEDPDGDSSLSTYYGQNGSIYYNNDGDFAFANDTDQRFGASTVVDGSKNQQQSGTTPSSLKGYWTLDNDNAWDISGNGNSGTLNGGVTTGASGQVNGAYDFDGSDDYTSLSSSSSASMSGASGWTVNAWVKPSQVSTQEVFVSKNSEYALKVESGSFDFIVGDGSNWGNFAGGTTSSISGGNWYMVTGRWDGSNLYIYLNGVQENNNDDGISSTGESSLELIFGNWNPTSGSWYSGDLDDVRIYDRALSSSEISALYDMGTSDVGTLGAEEAETTNAAPDAPTNPSPADGATGVSTSTSLSVDVSDPDGDSMDVSFYDASDDTQIGTTQTGVASGSTASVTWSGLSEGGHSWYAIADDGSATTQGDTWTFTVDTVAPSYSEVSDDSGGIVEEGTIVNTSVFWEDAKSYLDYGQFYHNGSGSFQLDVKKELGVWSLSTFSYDTVSLSTQDIGPTGMFFKDDGTKLYEVGKYDEKFYQYSCTNAWDLSSCSYDAVSISTQDTNPTGMFFKDDGTKLYEIGYADGNFYQYSCTDAWDLSSCSYDSVSKSTEDAWATGMFFKDDGTKLYEIGGAEKFYQYSCTNAWDLSSCSYDAVSISTQDTYPSGMFFKDDGTKLYEIGTGDSTFYQYSCTDAWNLTSCSYDAVSLSAQDTSEGMFFKDDGTKLYEVGSSDDMFYQYSSQTQNSWYNTTIDTTGHAGETIAWYQTANDTAGNENTSMSTSLNTFDVNGPPTYSNFLVENPTNYDPNTDTNISISWSDPDGNFDTSTLETNISGTPQNITGTSSYSKNLGAGTYYAKFYGEDTLGASNQTSKKTFTIDKATPSLGLSASPSWTETYPTTTDISGDNCPSQITCSLTRDSSSVSNPDSAELGAGDYTYDFLTSGNENYTSDSTSNTLTINKGTPSLSSSVTSPITYPTSSDYSASESNQGDSDLTYELYRENTLLTSGSSVSDSTELGAGTYDYEYNTTGGANWTSSTNTKTLQVDKGTPSASLTNDKTWTETYPTTVTIGYSESNQGDSDVTYTVLRDSSSIGSGETIEHSAGSYDYSVDISSGANWTSVTGADSNALTINQYDPTVDIYFENSTTTVKNQNITLEMGNELNVTSSIDVTKTSQLTDTNFNLYKDNSETGTLSGNRIEYLDSTLTLGEYYFDSSFDGNENYTSFTRDPTVTVEDTEPPQIDIQKPENKNYGTNESLPLNYTVEDQGVGVDSCWYSVINETGNVIKDNITLSGCENTTFDLPGGDIDYNLTVYSNDTEDRTNSSLRQFGVRTVVPTVTLDSPSDNGWIVDTYNNTDIKFTATDSDGIDTCKLYADFTGMWQVNETFTSVTSGNQVTTTKDLDNGTEYRWNVECNDTFDNAGEGLNNKTFTTSISPEITSQEYKVDNKNSLEQLIFGIDDKNERDIDSYSGSGTLDTFTNTSLILGIGLPKVDTYSVTELSGTTTNSVDIDLDKNDTGIREHNYDHDLSTQRVNKTITLFNNNVGDVEYNLTMDSFGGTTVQGENWIGTISGNSNISQTGIWEDDWIVNETNYDFTPNTDEVTLGVNYVGDRNFEYTETKGLNWTDVNTTSEVSEPSNCSQASYSLVNVTANEKTNKTIDFTCNPGKVGATDINKELSTPNEDSDTYHYVTNEMVINSNETSDTKITWKINQSNLPEWNDRKDQGAQVNGSSTDVSIEDGIGFVYVTVGTDHGNSSLEAGTYSAELNWVVGVTAPSGGGGGVVDDEEPEITVEFVTEDEYQVNYGMEEDISFSIRNYESVENTVGIEKSDDKACEYVQIPTTLTSGEYGDRASYTLPSRAESLEGEYSTTQLDAKVDMPNQTEFAEISGGSDSITCSFEAEAARGATNEFSVTLSPGLGLFGRIDLKLSDLAGRQVEAFSKNICLDYGILEEEDYSCPEENIVQAGWIIIFLSISAVVAAVVLRG